MPFSFSFTYQPPHLPAHHDVRRRVVPAPRAHHEPPPARPRFPHATTEDAALESYRNVRFSLARFREITGAYTTRMTVVGHSLRRRRFEQLHRLALRWPKTRFAYEGVSLGNEANKHETAADGARPLSFQFSHIHVENAWLVSLARAI